jgi:hypothetical protein
VKRIMVDGFVKRVLKKDVLYLMVVNLPSEEEMRAARVVSDNATKESKDA